MDLQIIQSKIYEIRGCRVMLDSDLAALYQVETKALKHLLYLLLVDYQYYTL